MRRRATGEILMPDGSVPCYHEDRPGAHYLVRRCGYPRYIAASNHMMIVAGPFGDCAEARAELSRATRDRRIPPPPTTGDWAHCGVDIARVPIDYPVNALPRVELPE